MAEDFRPIYEADGTLSVRFEAAQVTRADGSQYRHHRLVVADGRPGVVIVASSELGLLFVRSRRASTGEDLWELPRGSSEIEDAVDADDYADDTLLRAGLRELREESGFAGRNARVLGRYFTDTTMFPQRMGVISCTVDPASPRSETDGEIDEMQWIAIDEVDRLLREGAVKDSHTLVAITLSRAHTH